MRRITRHMYPERTPSRFASEKGDTIAETLCAILVAAAAAVILTTGVNVSMKITHDVKTTDETLQAGREAAAAQDSATGNGSVTFSWGSGSETLSSDFYGDAGIYSYKGTWS